MFKAAADAEAPQRGLSSENHMGSRLESLHVDCPNRFVYSEKILAVAQCKTSGEQAGVQTGEQVGVLARLPKFNLFGIRMQRRRLHEFQKLPTKQEDKEEVERSRHALAQKLIAKTLKQADRRPRRTRLKIATFFRIGLRIGFRTRWKQSRKGGRKIRVDLSRLVTRSGYSLRIPVRWLLQRLAGMMRCLKVDLCRRCDGWQQEHFVRGTAGSNFDEKLPLLASMS